jgi:predicted ArsR family transcriptional regulator
VSEAAVENERTTSSGVEAASVDLERDVFLRTLLRELSGTLEDVVGLDEAAGFISIVGARMGRGIDTAYRAALDQPHLDRDQVAEVLVDLKRRIEGGFSLEEVTDDHIVLVNDACPFGDKVLGRPSLCMMTSNVFGSITADNLGYAKVQLHETIAQGDGRCRVTVHLRPSVATLDAEGREYFGTSTPGA